MYELISKFNDYGLYNTEDLINNFDSLVGISFIDLLEEFNNTNDKLITEKDVINYCQNNFHNLQENNYTNEINNIIIERRTKDYEELKRIIKIYQKKGISILNIFLYIKSKNENKDIENKLEELDISHYGRIMCGRDIKRLLITLTNIINKYNLNIEKINNLNTYNFNMYDDFYYKSENKLPIDSLICDEDNYDKTSLIRVKKNTNKSKNLSIFV